MLYEIFSVASMLSIAGGAYYYKNKGSSNDHDKIKKIADENGLKTKEESIRIYRMNKNKGYIEYVYKMPLGLSFNQFEEHKQAFIDGLNNKSKPDLSLNNIKKIDYKGNILKQLRELLNNRIKLDKHLEMEYDGMLKFRVFEKGLESFYPFDDELLQKVSGWEIPIGYTYKGFFKHDFDKMPMLVVAGQTRYGKTVFLKNIITTLIHNKPEHTHLTLIDLKGGLAFNRFKDCKQVTKVAADASDTLEVLEDMHNRILDKQQEYLKEGYEDITEAGEEHRQFIIIDEGAEINGFEKNIQKDRAMYLIGEIARLGAGLGFRLVFATQYPTADIMDRSIKSNLSAAVCFRLKTATQSTVVLDKKGAESLPLGLKGRAIYQTDTERVVQTPFIENQFIDGKIKIHIQRKEENPDEHEQKRAEERRDTFEFKKM